MDGGAMAAKMVLDAGGTYVTIMSNAHWSSVKEMVKMARKMDGQVMVDVMNTPDKVAVSKEMQELGADWITLHTGYDERQYIKEASPLDDLQGVLDAVDIPVQAVGGLTLNQALETVRMGASSLVICTPMVNVFKVASLDQFETTLRDIVTKVQEISDTE